MRIKYNSPSGTGILQFSDSADVNTVFGDIASRTGLAQFTLRYGGPTAIKVLDHRHLGESARSLGLHGVTVTVVPEESSCSSAVPQSMRDAVPTNNPDVRDVKAEDITIPWPDREGTLLLRVMPSDNSCLFTAFGGALPDQIAAQRLRRMMADYIRQHSDTYSEAILGSSQESYCENIQNSDRWGGGIELSILSSIFNIQICTYDVQAQKLIQFGEFKKDRCILVFSGIHYDRVAFSFSEPPYDQTVLPPEMDRTLWPIEDDEVLNKTTTLVQKLHAAHYYTDTEGLLLRCDAPGCSWLGSGQIAGRQHAQQTGHVELSEIHDGEDDNIIHKCEAVGCDFIGQGDQARRRHIQDTGHERLSIIPDT